MKKIKAPLALTALALLAAVLFIAVSGMALTRAGEYLAPEEAVARQMLAHGIYGPALAPDIKGYKQALYRTVAPDVAALGAHLPELRAEDFSVPFVNLSGPETLDDVIAVGKTLFEEKPPKTVILGVDFHWFTEGEAPPSPPSVERGAIADARAFLSLYSTGHAAAGDTATLVSGRSPNVGVDAILRGDGYDTAGAYAYASLWTGNAASADEKFRADLDAIAKGADLFSGGDHIADAPWQKFTAFLYFLNVNGIQTVLVLPPVAPTVLEAMPPAKYRYVGELRKKLADAVVPAKGFSFFDVQDARALGADDCEFVDGLTPGTIALKRMLLDMAVKNPELRARLNLSGIGWGIAHYKGRASTLPQEADFLNLGCAKPAATGLN